MRITFIIESFGRGGKERRCLQLIQGLNKAGYSVAFSLKALESECNVTVPVIVYSEEVG